MAKILFLDQTGQLGGAELCLADIASHYRNCARVLLLSDGPFSEYLRSRGVETEILPLPPALAGIGKKASPASLAAALPSLPAFFTALRRRVRSHDLLYMNTAKALVHGTMAAWGTGIPSVFHLHDILDPAHFSAWNIRAIVTAANRARLVIANSEATSAAFVRAGGRSPTIVIPNGFLSSPFDAVTPAEIANLREALAVPSRHTVAALFGRIARWKGQHLLIEAAAQIPELTVWIVGDALFTGDDRAYADELHRRAAELGVTHRVHFLGFRRDIPNLMRAADIVVNCSVAAEPFGRVLVEGMLAARPVIAPREGGPCEIVEDGRTGFLVPPADAGAFAKALQHLQSDPALCDAMGHAGRARAESLFSLASVSRRTETALSSLLPMR